MKSLPLIIGAFWFIALIISLIFGSGALFGYMILGGIAALFIWGALTSEDEEETKSL